MSSWSLLSEDYMVLTAISSLILFALCVILLTLICQYRCKRTPKDDDDDEDHEHDGHVAVVMRGLNDVFFIVYILIVILTLPFCVIEYRSTTVPMLLFLHWWNNNDHDHDGGLSMFLSVWALEVALITLCVCMFASMAILEHPCPCWLRWLRCVFHKCTLKGRQCAALHTIIKWAFPCCTVCFMCLVSLNPFCGSSVRFIGLFPHFCAFSHSIIVSLDFLMCVM